MYKYCNNAKVVKIIDSLLYTSALFVTELVLYKRVREKIVQNVFVLRVFAMNWPKISR